MRRTTCGACGHDNLHPILDLGLSPVADAYTTSPGGNIERFPLLLAVCTGCHLVQLMDVLPQSVLFGTGYSFYSSASTPLSEYHREYAYDILRTHTDLARRLTVEVGCNDGDMLRHFDDAGCSTIGVDPAGGPVMTALERGLGVINESFTCDIARRIIDDYGQAGVIIANHVLAHVESVAETMAGISELLADDGVAYIEVQYLPDLLLNNAFDLVYHEHRNFFSLGTLASAASRWGLYIYDVELTDRQGGSLRATLGHSDRYSNTSVERVKASECWLSTVNAYGGLQGRAERMRDRLHDLIHASSRNGLVIGYGAPAKATTLLNFCELTGDDLAYIIDSTLAKQGRYIPGTNIKIVPEVTSIPYDVGTVLLTAWNYTRSIMRRHTNYTKHDGRWIIPVPTPMIF